MTEHHDELSVAPDPARAEDLRRDLHARMARVSRDVHGRDLAVAEDAEVSEDGATVDLYVTEPEPAARTDRGRWGRTFVVGAAAAVVLLATLGVIIRHDEQTIEPFTPVPAANGWIAQQFGGEVWLVQEGEADRRVNYGRREGAEVCPAFSPDGERLLIGTGDGQDGGSGAALDVVAVAADGTFSLDATIPIEGIDAIPCAIWASDGRWAALGGGDAVWVVDTETGDVRRVPSEDPGDLEWRPGTDELAITGRAVPGGVADAPITIYTVSTDEVRTIDEVEAAELTWSPDGTTIAYTQAVPGSPTTRSGISLIDADGTDPRPLTTDDYVARHGIGVVWSPLGGHIAYQRERGECTGDACYEQTEVVLVTATDADPDAPVGTERVVPPVPAVLEVKSDDGSSSMGSIPEAPWYPHSVTWSPDGTQLLYSAGFAGLLAVPVDPARPAVLLSSDLLTGATEDLATSPWIPLQQWQAIR